MNASASAAAVAIGVMAMDAIACAPLDPRPTRASLRPKSGFPTGSRFGDSHAQRSTAKRAAGELAHRKAVKKQKAVARRAGKR